MPAQKNQDEVLREKGQIHDDLMPLLEAMFREFQDASKKKPDGVISKQKVQIVNRLLEKVLALLEGETTRAYLDQLDEDQLPQNSDVALILSQVVAAMAAFKQKYYGWDGGLRDHVWSANDKR